MSLSLISSNDLKRLRIDVFHLMISERDLIDLCFAGLCPSIKEKIEHYEFHNVNQLMQKAISIESCLKES